MNRMLFFAIVFAFARPGVAETRDHQFPVIGSGSPAPAKYGQAVGKLTGPTGTCSATIVSPPDSPVLSILTAAHCGAMSRFQINGRVIDNVSCIGNKFFVEGPHPRFATDLSVCFAKSDFKSEVNGCLSSEPVRVGDDLRLMGFGAPGRGFGDVGGGPPLEHLVWAANKVSEIEPTSGGIYSQGSTHLTKGDSGGPLVRASDEGAGDARRFDIVGVNSEVVNIDGRVYSAFPAFTPQNFDFFTRAIARYQARGGAVPIICGVNDKEPREPRTPPRSPASPPHAPPAHEGTTPPDHHHSVHPGTLAEIFAEALDARFPRDIGDVGSFVEGLNPARVQILRSLLRAGPQSQTYRQFAEAFRQPKPSAAVLEKVRERIEHGAAPSVLPTPSPSAMPTPIPHGGLPPAPTDLVPPGVGGSPGWQYRARSQTHEGHLLSCGATLIAATGGTCLAATARHCLEEAVRDGHMQVQLPGTASYISARTFLNATAQMDTAAFSWACPQGAPAGMPVVALHDGPIESASLVYGKVQRDPGLHAGSFAPPAPNVIAIDGLPPGHARAEIRMDGKPVVQGDSGSGLFVRSAGGQLTLAGILAAYHDRNAIFMTNHSLDVLRKLVAAPPTPQQ